MVLAACVVGAGDGRAAGVGKPVAGQWQAFVGGIDVGIPGNVVTNFELQYFGVDDVKFPEWLVASKGLDEVAARMGGARDDAIRDDLRRRGLRPGHVAM